MEVNALVCMSAQEIARLIDDPEPMENWREYLPLARAALLEAAEELTRDPDCALAVELRRQGMLPPYTPWREMVARGCGGDHFSH